MGNEQVVNFRNKNARIFSDYVTKHFDMQQLGVNYKYYHTFRVAELCYESAKKLKLNADLAYNIGLLHDYSRFTQWEKYQTFYDKDSFDHADEAARLLFDLGEIKNFKISKKYYDIIRFAVKNHNKFKVDLTEIEGKKNAKLILQYANLIRDCDKADIVIMFSKMTSFLDKKEAGVSKKVLESFKKRETVLFSDIKTTLDEIICRICLLFDFAFKETIEIVNITEFAENVLKTYSKLLNKKDFTLLKEILNELIAYFKN